MGLFGTLFAGPPAASKPAPAVTFNVPAALPRLEGQSAAAISQRAGQAPLAGAPDRPAGYIDALLKQQRPVEAAGVLAHGLPEKDGVRWAADSSEMVAAKQTPADAAATQAAKQWIAQPTSANQAAAADAASKAGHGGPGAWAAQAAAWTGPSAPAAAATAPGPLVSKAVLGSVMLSAAMNKPGLQIPAVPTLNTPTVAAPAQPALPPEATSGSELCAVYKPFLDRGLQIAAGA